jgi:hypothetical protein
MPVLGSSLINTSANGQPTDLEDRPFSFAIGTQIFINPDDDPTDAVVSFKLDASLLNGTLAAGDSNLALGFAIDSELNTLSNWGQSQITSASANRFPIGFGRLATAPTKIGVNVSGTQVMTLARPTSANSVSEANNEIVMNDHPFNTGDRVRVSSTGVIPGNLSASVSYYVIRTSNNAIRLSTSYTGAVGGSEVDIQTAGSGTITVASDEILTLTRSGSTGSVTLKKGSVTVATFTETNSGSPLRLFYWCREQSASSTLPVLKEIKVRGAI